MKWYCAVCIRIANWRSKDYWMLCINMVVCQNVPGIGIVDVDDADAESWLTALHRR